MKANTSPQPAKIIAGTPLRELYSRVLAYMFVAAVIAAGTSSGFFSYGLLWLVPYSLLYPHLSYFISSRLKRNHPTLAYRGSFFLDAMHTGAVIALMGFAIIPTLMALLISVFSALILGGIRLMLPMLLITLAIAGTTGLLLQSPIALEAPLLVSVVSVVFAAIYICVTAYFVHFQGIYLAKVQLDIKREQEKAARLAQSLAKYLSPQVWQTIFSGKRTVKLETQRKKLTVFFSDIKGFTELSEELEAEALTDVLNNYLNEMSKIALKYGGTIDKFIGDSVMVFFGDPNTQGAKKDAIAAVSMAIAMRKHMKVLRQQWRAQGIDKPLEIRMGINTGYCTVGNFGADTRMDYTIIGREVNLASRLESASESGEILMSNETYSLTKDVVMARDKGQITVRGFSRPVQIFQVVDFRRDLGASSSYVEHELPGFSMYLDTNNIQNYDKERVIGALKEAAERLRDKIIM
ncbi:MAG TPA: adenylate cyclase [Gammaproteobacteria bacterium]|nr:adenylate cyclase [Gammaproteobacteria bacterium]